MKKKVLAAILSAGMAVGMGMGGMVPVQEVRAEDAQEDTKEDAKDEAQEEAQEEKTIDAAGIKIGILLNQASTQVISSMGNAMVAKAEELGAEPTLMYYDMDVPTFISDVENFISSDYDVIIAHPMNADDGADALKEAYDKGINIITFDTIINGDYNHAFVASNYDVGYKIGESAAKWAQENLVAKDIDPVIGLVNYPSSEFLSAREEGIRAAIEELLPEGEIVITGAGTTELEGLEAGENFLQAYPDMNVVVSINDDTMHGVYQAFSGAGYADAQDRGLFSCDGTEQSKELVKAGGVFKCVVDLELDSVGESMVECGCLDILGQNDKYEEVNYFPMNPLTIDNIDEFWTPSQDKEAK